MSDVEAYAGALTGACAGGVASLTVLHWYLNRANRIIEAVAASSASPQDVDKLVSMAIDSDAIREKIFKAERYWRNEGNEGAADRLLAVLLRSSPGPASIQQNPSHTHSLPNPNTEDARRVQQSSPTADRRRRGQDSAQVQPPFFAAFDIESQQQPPSSERDMGNQGDPSRDGSRRPSSGLRHSSDVNLSLPREPTASPARQESWVFSRRPSGQVRRESGPRQATSDQRGFQRGPEQVAPGGTQQQSSTRGTARESPPQPPRSRQTTHDTHIPLAGIRQPIPGRARRQTEQAPPQNQPRSSPLPRAPVRGQE